MQRLSESIGDSSLGHMIINKEKHHDTVHGDESEIATRIIENHFYNVTELLDIHYKLEKKTTKEKISLDTPIYLDVFILICGKLRMLQFQEDFIDHYLSRENLAII